MMRHSRPTPLLLLLAACGAASAAEPDPLRGIEHETLVYSVRAWQGLPLFSFNLGTVTFTMDRDESRGERQAVFQALASGGVPGYPYVATMTSRVSDADYASRDYRNVRTKKGYKAKWLRFQANGADYLKTKHCKSPTLCHNPRHLVRREDGSPVHCTGCDDPAHYVWTLKERHRFDGPAADMLAALYLARRFDLKPGGPSASLRVLTDHELFAVTLSAEKEETVTVPAGQIPCLKIGFRAEVIQERPDQEADFDGFFGLGGQVELYVDKATRQLVLVHGKVKLGATFDVEVALTRRTVTRVPGAAPAGP